MGGAACVRLVILWPLRPVKDHDGAPPLTAGHAAAAQRAGRRRGLQWPPAGLGACRRADGRLAGVVGGTAQEPGQGEAGDAGPDQEGAGPAPGEVFQLFDSPSGPFVSISSATLQSLSAAWRT